MKIKVCDETPMKGNEKVNLYEQYTKERGVVYYSKRVDSLESLLGVLYVTLDYSFMIYDEMRG